MVRAMPKEFMFEVMNNPIIATSKKSSECIWEKAVI